jgi:hypothetical protein
MMNHFMVHIKNFLDTLHVSFFFGIMQISNAHILLSNVGEETKWVMEKKVLGPHMGVQL